MQEYAIIIWSNGGIQAHADALGNLLTYGGTAEADREANLIEDSTGNSTRVISLEQAHI